MNEEHLDHPFEILLIDDNQHDAELTMRALNKNNFGKKLVYLKDGAEALEFLFGSKATVGKNLGNNPRLIILDLKMPKVDGTEILGKLKSEKHTRSIPVVVLSSSREESDIQTCYDLGANSYVVKPVIFDDFMSAVSDLSLYWMIVNQIGR